MSISSKIDEIFSTIKQGSEIKDPAPIACYNCNFRDMWISKIDIKGKGRIFISASDDRDELGKLTIDGTLVINEDNYDNYNMPICIEFSKSVVGIPTSNNYAVDIGIVLY